MAHSAIVPPGRVSHAMQQRAGVNAEDNVHAPQTAWQRDWRKVGWAALLFSVLQAACPAIIAERTASTDWLGGLASAAGTTAAPRGLHQDGIRIPMMALAALGAALNLFVVQQIRRLRVRPAAQWRLSPADPSKAGHERVQIGLAVLTLLVAEWITHSMVHLSRP